MNDKKHIHDEHCNHDHNHDHDHDHEHEDMDVIYLTLDDDTELECAVLGIFEVEDKEYIALLPIDDEEVLLYEYKELEDEEFDLLPIEEEDFELVSEAFNALYSEDDEEDDGEDDEVIEVPEEE